MSLIEYLKGKKTYILAVVIIAYAVCAALGFVPDPSVVGAFLVVVSGFAITLRAALASFYKEVQKK